MDHLSGIVCGPRPGRMRDRRGRGIRGPLSLPGPLSPSNVPANRTAREDFDGLVTEVLTRLRPQHALALDAIEIAVEEAPILPKDWTDEVPLSVVVSNSFPTRLIIFRKPIVHRAASNEDLANLVWTTMLDRFGQLWNTDPCDLDPRPEA